MIRKTISVSELNKHIKEIIEGDISLRNIYVNGEISNFKFHSSGHMYFTLKDEYSKIKCIMFPFISLQKEFAMNLRPLILLLTRKIRFTTCIILYYAAKTLYLTIWFKIFSYKS